MPTKFYIDVAVPVPLRKTFIYLPLENSTISQYSVGARVSVPFGKRCLIGVITNIVQNIKQRADLTDFDLKKIKAITRILDQENILTPSIIDLSNFAAGYYHHPIGEVYVAGLPKPVKQGEDLHNFNNKLIFLNTDGQFLLDHKKLSKAQQKVIKLLIENKGCLSYFTLNHLGIASSTIKSLINNKWLFIKPNSTEPIKIHEIANQSFAHLSRTLVPAPPQQSLQLNLDQNTAFNTIISKLENFHAFLLYGITGSGKTEVYLRVIQNVLQLGKQVLVLVPEISLTPQTISRFKSRFNVKIAVIHSKINLTNKAQDWTAAKNGEAKIIIGTRSAIFTPILDLGLIIIDEEHDLSFKQQEGFRYNARDLAVIRAQKCNIPIILGSATPALESVANVVNNKYELLTLKLRAGDAVQPKIKLLNIKQKPLTAGLSTELIKLIESKLKQQQQVLLFLNRRGYAPVIKCQDCNWGGICSRCNIYFTYHKFDQKLVCHYCTAEQRLPNNCPDCGSIDLKSYGVGTEQIEDYIKKILPDYPCIRIDRDTTRTKNSLDGYLEQIHENKPMILLGTQMLAKGHHFPQVSLVAILDVDNSLFSTDFRASERITQLVLQVAGRAGRGNIIGEVVIQTTQPEHKVLQDILHKDYWDIAVELYGIRKLVGQPPAGFWVLLRAESYDLTKTMDFLGQIKQCHAHLNGGREGEQSVSTTKIFGPILAPRPKKAGLLRGQLLISAHNRQHLHIVMTKLLEKIECLKTPSVKWSLDVDPLDIY